jgi:hypothetical protein
VAVVGAWHAVAVAGGRGRCARDRHRHRAPARAGAGLSSPSTPLRAYRRLDQLRDQRSEMREEGPKHKTPNYSVVSANYWLVARSKAANTRRARFCLFLRVYVGIPARTH